jgi:hypothetical protein
MKIWMGLCEPRIDLVEDVERLLRAQGHDVTWRSYPTLPSGEALTRLLGFIAAKHDVFAWIAEEIGPSAAELEKSISAAGHSDRHLFFQVKNEQVSLLGGAESLGPATANPDTSFHMARVLRGKSDAS